MSDKDVEVLKRSVDRILQILENDDKTDSKGLVATVHTMQTDLYAFIQEYKKKEAITKAVKNTKLAIWGMIGSALLWVLEKIIEKLTVLLHL